jgi:RNA polymerase sigma factor (sigma-70 family)
MADESSKNYRGDKSIVPTEAELENLLDSESDDEFGQTESQVASVDIRAVLKTWTAQDFSNIYTRFRPHLERHARRFLRNQSQVDEVVQDAFLYLMVTLPELDSELGVLRFLKWKVRLLSLDVIRINSKVQLSDIDAHAEFESDEPEVGVDLERAEDAAVVQMALAKLDPRHREVLIASIYQEKSTLEIAEQVGLTENATRQLMHRARGALKKALVGEADTNGLSISQIFSVAARKAAQDAKKVGVQAMSTLVIAVLGLAAFLNFGPSAQVSEIAAPAPSSTTSENAPVASEQQTAPAESTTQDAPFDAQPGETLAESSVSTPESGTESGNAVETLEVAEVTTAAAPSAAPAANAPILATAAVDPLTDFSPFDPWLIDPILDNEILSPLLFAPESSSFGESQLLTVVSDSGVWADVRFNSNSRSPFSSVRLGFLIDGQQFFASPNQTDLLVDSTTSGNYRFTFTGRIGSITDEDGSTWTQSRLRGAVTTIAVTASSTSGEVFAVDVDIAK